MQNIAVNNALQCGYLQVPFSPLVTHGFLDLADFAAVAAAILRARPSAHARTRYELVGDLASYRDVAQWLSESARMPITIERVDRDTAVQRQVQSGRLRDAYGCNALARMISYYEEQYVEKSIELSVSEPHLTLTLFSLSSQWSDRQSEYLTLAPWSGTPVSEAVHRARSADLILGGCGPQRLRCHPTTLVLVKSLDVIRTCIY
jgi:hypothetical protein